MGILIMSLKKLKCHSAIFQPKETQLLQLMLDLAHLASAHLWQQGAQGEAGTS